MFIFWGRKVVTRRVGYVADFCPICRGPRPFELQRIGSASHVYYISVGDGQLVGHDRCCQECGTSFKAEPTHYASISKKLTPLPELTMQTFPNFAEALKERLALEHKIQHNSSSLSAEERYNLIRSPFLFLSPKVEKRFASTHIDKEIGISIVAAIALLFIGPVIAQAVSPENMDIAVLIFILLGLILVVWQVVLSGRRFMKRQIIPLLAKTLQPLKPTESELQTVLAELGRLGHKIGKKLKLADLVTEMEASKGEQLILANRQELRF